MVVETEQLSKLTLIFHFISFLFYLFQFSIISGEEVAFYFAWMSFFTWSLLPIALFGAALFLHRPKGITVDASPYLPIYALLMAFWTIVYIKVRKVTPIIDNFSIV